MSNPVVSDSEVKKIIDGDYSLLRKAAPFLTLLSRFGWYHLGKARFSDELHFDSAEQMGMHLKKISGEYGSPQYNLLLNYIDFVSHLNLIHEDKFSLGSLKDNPLGLFVCWVAAHCHFSSLHQTLSMSVVDDKQKLEDIFLLINAHVFEYSSERPKQYDGPLSSNSAWHNISSSSMSVITDGNGNNFEYSKQPFHPSNIENKKRTIIANLFNWWKENKIKEFEWLPLQKGDAKTAEWCWDRIKAIQGKEKINLSAPSLFSSSPPLLQNQQNLIHFLDRICGEQYQFAVYAYFCFVAEPFARDMLRNKITGLYRAKKFKTKNKGKTINVTVSEGCKNGLDRLTKHYNKKQADILNELIEKACKELPEQGRP